MAAAVQQAMVQMQSDLDATRAQVLAITQAHDTLKAAHEALNHAAQVAIGQKTAEIAASEEKLKGLIFRQQFDLLDSASLRPEPYKGRKTESFKPWKKKFEAYCNSKRQGFRQALDWAAKQQSEIIDPSQSGWEFAVAASPKLHDYLLQVLQEDAVMLIDKPELADRGFESWRILVRQYEPSGGAYELDAMMALMTIKQVRDMSQLPAAVARFEKNYRAYEARTGHTFPQEWKAPAFLRMLPGSHAGEMRWRFSQGLTNYDQIVASVLSYSQHLRHEDSFRRDNDMQCDSAERRRDLSSCQSLFSGAHAENVSETWSDADPEEEAAYYKGFAAGMAYDGDEEVGSPTTDEPSDALKNKGKGKGKGKGRQIWASKGGKDSGKGAGTQAVATGKGQRRSAYVTGAISRDISKSTAERSRPEWRRKKVRDQRPET